MAKPSTEGNSNPFRLPRGEPLRRAVVAAFRAQRAAVLRYLTTGRKSDAGRLFDSALDLHVGRGGRLRGESGGGSPDLGGVLPEAQTKDQAPDLPLQWPDWHDFGLGPIDLARRFTPLLTLTWEAAAAKFAPRVGLDPNSWTVVNPHTERMIDEAALAFSDSMNATTSKSLESALAETRQALREGIVTHGEALPALTKRIQAIFDGAAKYRARAIAATETSRAVHSAQEAAAIASEVVTGWKWMLSSDACPICVAIAARAPAVRLGHAFAVIGDNPHYSEIKFPPAHVHCNCSLYEVLDSDPQPAWTETLHQPEPATDDEVDRVGRDVAERDDATLRGSKRRRPTPARRPAPLRRKAHRLRR